MTTADWAFVISFFSLLTAIASFVWNVWSKFIYPKAKLHLTINIMELVPNPRNIQPFVSLSATNHGPTDVTLHSAIAGKTKKFMRKRKVVLILPAGNISSANPTSDGPFTGGLPKKLAVGEVFSVHFPVSKNWRDECLTKFGFHDLYGRIHWCSRKVTRDFLRRFDVELQRQLHP